ncbi:Lysosomal acid lipase/cholesteryl ester hydrolase, partial [Tetrabaena socialis]
MATTMAVAGVALPLLLLLLAVQHAKAADTQSTKGVPADLVPPPFELERHTVNSDGYQLALFRLKLIGQDSPRNRTPVVLHHGFSFSADIWFPLPLEEGLSYILYRAGYDVWAVSDRGTRPSQQHDTLSPLQREFWRFNLDDMALRDLPTLFDYVLTATGGSRPLATITWSALTRYTPSVLQGSTQTFMLGSLRPTAYPSTRICANVALAPVVFPQRISAPLLTTLLLTRFDLLVQDLDAQLFAPAITQGVLGTACALQLLPELLAGPTVLGAQVLCDAIGAAGFGPPQLEPEAVSVGMTVQYGQAFRRGPHTPVLLRYDYGRTCDHVVSGWDRTCNREVYGTDEPPEYNISNYVIPTTLITGARDLVSVPWDAKNVAARLQPGVLRAAVVLPEHGHLDFVTYDARAFSGSVLQ